MPVRNIYKDYVAESYYHIYNRGLNKADIFVDEQDFSVFLSLLKRYLGAEIEKRPSRTAWPNYHHEIELLAFCLMKNHFHLFIYQHSSESIREFMKSLSVSYSMYFNKRYKRSGPVFGQRYKAVRVTDDAQLLHVTRYIHMNPESFKRYEWSSLPYYLGNKEAPWVRPDRVMEMFYGGSYSRFLNEYRGKRAELKLIKQELADS